MVQRTLGLLLTLSLVLLVGCSSQVTGCSSQSASNNSDNSTTTSQKGSGANSKRESIDADGRPTIDGVRVGYRAVPGFYDPPYDFSNPDLVVAASDYVVVARVDKCTGTRHPDWAGNPLTDYDVTILEVIKGNLEAGQKIPITKQGGISKDKSYFSLFDENDFMPEVGEIYVFVIQVLSVEKTLSVGGSARIALLESDVAAELKRIEKSKASNKQELINKCLEKSEVYARYVAAAENKDAASKLPPGIRDKERFKSPYEK